MALALITVLASCGGSSTPTAPTPTIAQAAGVWVGNVTQTSATGTTFECVALFQLSNGLSDRYTVSITQSNASLTAIASSQTSGQSCTYPGTAGTKNVALNATTCNPAGYSLTCNGAARDAYLFARSVPATVSGNTMTGTVGESWNVFLRGTTTNGLGTVTVGNTFTFTR